MEGTRNVCCWAYLESGLSTMQVGPLACCDLWAKHSEAQRTAGLSEEHASCYVYLESDLSRLQAEPAEYDDLRVGKTGWYQDPAGPSEGQNAFGCVYLKIQMCQGTHKWASQRERRGLSPLWEPQMSSELLESDQCEAV